MKKTGHGMEYLFIALLTIALFLVPRTTTGSWLIACSIILIAAYLWYREDEGEL